MYRYNAYIYTYIPLQCLLLNTFHQVIHPRFYVCCRYGITISSYPQPLYRIKNNKIRWYLLSVIHICHHIYLAHHSVASHIFHFLLALLVVYFAHSRIHFSGTNNGCRRRAIKRLSHGLFNSNMCKEPAKILINQ